MSLSLRSGRNFGAPSEELAHSTTNNNLWDQITNLLHCRNVSIGICLLS